MELLLLILQPLLKLITLLSTKTEFGVAGLPRICFILLLVLLLIGKEQLLAFGQGLLLLWGRLDVFLQR